MKTRGRRPGRRGGSGGGEPQRPEVWAAPAPRAAAITAATKIGMWGLVACGPLALVAAAAGPGGSGDPVAAAPQRSAVGPAGFAELYVTAYLRSGSTSTDLKAFYPDAPAISGEAGQRTATRTVATAAREVRPGYWSITVAADVAARAGNGAATSAVHYFTVPVIAAGDATAGGDNPAGTPTSYVATALPAEVAAPAVAAAPQLAYGSGQQITGGPLGDTIREFAAAYLTGAGDLSRYLTPGTPMRPITPAPYRQVTITNLTLAADLPGVEDRVPADGTAVGLLVDVEVTDAAAQRWPLSYALTATARAGRWEVSALDAAPALDPSAPSAPPGPTGSPAPALSPPGTTDPSTSSLPMPGTPPPSP